MTHHTPHRCPDCRHPLTAQPPVCKRCRNPRQRVDETAWLCFEICGLLIVMTVVMMVIGWLGDFR